MAVVTYIILFVIIIASTAVSARKQNSKGKKPGKADASDAPGRNSGQNTYGSLPEGRSSGRGAARKNSRTAENKKRAAGGAGRAAAAGRSAGAGRTAAAGRSAGTGRNAAGRSAGSGQTSAGGRRTGTVQTAKSRGGSQSAANSSGRKTARTSRTEKNPIIEAAKESNLQIHLENEADSRRDPMAEVYDLIVLGPKDEISFERDFLSEGMDMLNEWQTY